MYLATQCTEEASLFPSITDKSNYLLVGLLDKILYIGFTAPVTPVLTLQQFWSENKILFVFLDSLA